MSEENKSRLTLEEGQAMLKTLLKEVKYGPVSIEKAQMRMEEIVKKIQYPIDDASRPVADGNTDE